MSQVDKNREAVSERFYEELQDTFFFQVHRMQKAFFRDGNRLLQESGIELQLEQFPIILTVEALKSVSQREIADITHRDKSSVLRSVNALQRKGLLTIEQDVVDKRKNIVSITKEGLAMTKKMKQLMRKADELAFKAFTESEKNQAMQSLRSIADKLENR
jgi:DNA-binding MarR family transcriptional regulator